MESHAVGNGIPRPLPAKISDKVQRERVTGTEIDHGLLRDTSVSGSWYSLRDGDHTRQPLSEWQPGWPYNEEGNPEDGEIINGDENPSVGAAVYDNATPLENRGCMDSSVLKSPPPILDKYSIDSIANGEIAVGCTPFQNRGSFNSSVLKSTPPIIDNSNAISIADGELLIARIGSDGTMELSPTGPSLLCPPGRSIKVYPTEYTSSRINELNEAATSVQSLWRGKADRRTATEFRESMNSSAARVQAAYRGKATREEVRDMTASAVKVQAIHRGNTSRKIINSELGAPQQGLESTHVYLETQANVEAMIAQAVETRLVAERELYQEKFAQFEYYAALRVQEAERAAGLRERAAKEQAAALEAAVEEVKSLHLKQVRDTISRARAGTENAEAALDERPISQDQFRKNRAMFESDPPPQAVSSSLSPKFYSRGNQQRNEDLQKELETRLSTQRSIQEEQRRIDEMEELRRQEKERQIEKERELERRKEQERRQKEERRLAEERRQRLEEEQQREKQRLEEQRREEQRREEKRREEKRREENRREEQRRQEQRREEQRREEQRREEQRREEQRREEQRREQQRREEQRREQQRHEEQRREEQRREEQRREEHRQMEERKLQEERRRIDEEERMRGEELSQREAEERGMDHVEAQLQMAANHIFMVSSNGGWPKNAPSSLSDFLGHYTREATLVNGRFAYAKRDNPNRMMWFLPGENALDKSDWIIGHRKKLGQSFGLMVCRDASILPENCRGHWEIWEREKGGGPARWKIMPDICCLAGAAGAKALSRMQVSQQQELMNARRGYSKLPDELDLSKQASAHLENLQRGKHGRG